MYSIYFKHEIAFFVFNAQITHKNAYYYKNSDYLNSFFSLNKVRRTISTKKAKKASTKSKKTKEEEISIKRRGYQPKKILNTENTPYKKRVLSEKTYIFAPSTD